MKYTDGNYKDYIEKMSPKTNAFTTLIWAFLIGGAICTIGQLIMNFYKNVFPDFSSEQIGSAVSATLIFFGAFATGLGLYDRLGAFAGAGSMVPITGFANSVVSPALEFKTEGMIYGLACKMFIISGPIIVYGVIGSGLVGLIYYIFV